MTVSWSLDDFKKTSMEVGRWCWGTMQGAFNEKQTISQILTDAAIGMIPVLGDVTAVRDLLAVSIGMSTDPRKREEVSEWILLVVLVFALIPVYGGVIKGVGRLALRATGDVAKDQKLLVEVVHYLNRIGYGDALRWLRSLHVKKYQAQILERLKAFCENMHRVIDKVLNTHVGQMLPNPWQVQLQTVAGGFDELPRMADRMVPKALDELENKIRVLQNTAYDGEKRSITTGGKPKVERESEAVLEEKVRVRKLPQGKYRANPALVENERMIAALRAKYDAWIAKGWPDLFRRKDPMAVFSGKEAYSAIASFHGAIAAWDAAKLAGKKVFRVFGNAGEIGGESFAGGMYWGVGKIPETAEEWREFCAVLDRFNANGYMTVAHLPDNLASLWPEAKLWMGKVAEQFDTEAGRLQYLEGGGDQLFGSFGPGINEAIKEIGEEMKKGRLGDFYEKEVNGVLFKFYKTNWENVEKLFGYGKIAEDAGAASTRKLAHDEVRNK
ncbi:hypothetical protein [Burkholderia territorii]|uniref:hypothetical protein n=1 Tax=Burkholderia territorii TaxID=1503055 RepID=UPI00075396D0|nr:hypothetical protein [Burkholderia territorii]AOI64235.1 hypothetical protein WS51_10935 [Burkholderia territorii]KWA12381.1 hypothetical protein WT37_01290 [Burkholderia territorii]KWE29809.1 hypothetical protein WT49_25875 [Burkholderia territorii]KWE38130.1 hypothetical protein WT51_31095 [Burkholderia territorii]KWE47262.1 hypothetical protein WT50_08515 [Burkholderia territorii]